jgi:hypothetical protein
MGNLVNPSSNPICLRANINEGISFSDINLPDKNLEENNENNFKKQIIVPYDASSNIFFMNYNITKIQSVFRGYVKRKDIKSKLFEKKISNIQIKEELTKSSTSPNNIEFDNINNINIHNEINTEINTNYVKENLNSIFKTIKNNYTSIQSTKTFFSLKQEDDTLQKKKININIINDEIIGYFLLKKSKSLKYKGEKDKLTHQKNGFGIVEWDDKSKLLGRFENNKICGICKFYNKEKEGIFSGIYKENFPEGYGIYKTLNYKLEGIWNKNILNGIGIEKNENTIYEGEFQNNKKHGIGTYKWSDGTIYKGEFKNNKMSGYGIIFYNDGRIFAGEIINGNMNGIGFFKWKNGDMYLGNYIKNDKCGFGIFIWKKKPLIAFAGFWDKGKQNGVGVKINDNVLKYGLWKNGQKELWINFNDIRKYLLKEQEKYLKILGKNILVLINKLEMEDFEECFCI